MLAAIGHRAPGNDDSDFDAGVLPTQHFVLGPGDEMWPHGYLITACNERGFSERDVLAVCNISHSNKSAAQRTASITCRTFIIIAV